ncbi:MAG: purine-nucleoside phosphorylase [Clostridiales bacterium]|nr:purine-nucleoside phosphorylase [Clostridiales bacterium]
MDMTPTPHIGATAGQIADTVLMPGDPLRARFIAENYLDKPELYNEVRGMLGYTGSYKGKRVSVQGSGMGIPSFGIYSYELFSFYDVKRIIRVGTAGALHPDLRIGDVVLAMGACTNSAFADQYKLPGTFVPLASFSLLQRAVREVEKNGGRYMVGSVLSSDTFYSADNEASAKWRDMGVLAAEMETAALYMTAAYLKKEALTILTVSDHIFTGEATDAATRQTAFTRMMEIALECAVNS